MINARKARANTDRYNKKIHNRYRSDLIDQIVDNIAQEVTELSMEGKSRCIYSIEHSDISRFETDSIAATFRKHGFTVNILSYYSGIEIIW